MAKGNLLLGTAGNSVGDVVMYRREGAQVSRVRVRKIKNPKTDAQSLQRAAFSPVAKFYSPLAIVLERSFEGLSKMKSYNKFLKTNIDLARANGWLLPKGTGFFPLPYKLSHGSLPVLPVTFDSGSNAFTIGISGAITTLGDFSTAMQALGFNNGDIVTFIGVKANGSDVITSDYYPISTQIELDDQSDVAIADAIPGFNVRSVAGPGGDVVNFGDSSFKAAAIVVARYQNEVWRRNSQSLVVMPAVLSYITNAEHKAAAIASYGMNAGDPNPLVYLDGDTLEG